MQVMVSLSKDSRVFNRNNGGWGLKIARDSPEIKGKNLYFIHLKYKYNLQDKITCPIDQIFVLLLAYLCNKVWQGNWCLVVEWRKKENLKFQVEFAFLSS